MHFLAYRLSNRSDSRNDFFMASPFSIFRKNQRLWMAGAVLIAVLAFVVAPMMDSFSSFGRGGPRNSDSVAASWSGGSITQNQLDTELTQLAIANTFLRKLANDVRDKGGFPRVPEVRPDFSIVGIAQETRDPTVILQRKLLVAEAKRLGIQFDEQSVKTFLQKFVDGKLTGEQIQKTLREVSGGRMTLIDFYRMMREELAKNALLRLAGTTFRFEERIESQALPTAVITPPSKSWQFFQRFNRSVTTEVYPVSIKDFEAAVTSKPTDRELRTLFDEGKDIARIDVPVVTQPAFMTPQLADFEFIACDVQKLIDEAMAKIPEETLRAEYDRRVGENQFRVPKTDSNAVTDPAAVPSDATPPESNLPPTLENPESQPDPAAEPKNPQGAWLPGKPAKSAVRLASYQDPAEPTETGLTIQDPPAEPAVPQSTAVPPVADAVQIGDTVPPTGDTVPPTGDAVPPTGDAVPADLSSMIQNLGGALNPTGQPPANGPEMRVQTFEEVRETIARELAAGEAFKLLEQRATDIRDTMEIYSVNRRAYERAVLEKDKTAVAPEPLNLQDLADKNGFEYGRTGLVDVRTVSTLPIGRSRVTRGIRMQPFEFYQLIRVEPDPYESDNIGNLYVPLTSSSMLTRFIFWKVEQKSASTPSFEAAKESVEALWLTQRAAELAETKAKEIASRVGSSSLTESLEDESQRARVQRPTPFTWLNAMFANFDIQLSTVDGLQPIGDDFMEKVFSTQPGESIVAPDMAREVFYVVKVLGFSPDSEDLINRFSTAPNTTGVQNAANLESARALPAWFSSLQKRLGLQQR